MAQDVADFMLARLREWDVRTVFGYAGDGINCLLAAWGRADNQPEFVQVRHEELAAFEAVGYAKFSGRPGLCVATSGPGAIHLLNGLYDAKLDHVSVVAIVGQTARSAVAAVHNLEVSAHCAQNLTAPVTAATPNIWHLEWFHDHERIKTMLFDGALDPTGGADRPALDRPGHGMSLRDADADAYRVA